ncbi:MAG: sugar ABC transporter substrate-binding protein [Fimbriimonadaceae bacterium]|nr:sugar ABC transporter substrate-binding protein [Fimbriimonadaceae bacterium]
MLRLLTLCALAILIARMVVVALRPAVDPPTTGVVTIEMSVWGMPWENDLYTKVYIPEFERQNPKIKVKFHHFEDYGNRILLSHAGGIAPDVIRQGLESNMSSIRRGMNLPLNKYIDGPDGIDRRDFIPILWDGLKYRGETYGVPQDINILGLYFNKDLFDRAGIGYPDENWTWSDLKSAAEKLTKDVDGDGHPDVVGFDIAWGAGTYKPFVFQAGGEFWSKDGERTVIDSPEAAEALKFYRSLMRNYSLTKATSQRGGLGPDKFFESGKVAIYMDGSWITPSLKKNAPNLRFGVAPLPRGKRAMSVSGSCFWAIASQSRHPDEAWKLTKFLTSTEALTRYWQFLWVAPPARWSALRSPRFKQVSGAVGRIPGIDSPQEFAEKCGWITKVLENGWTTVRQSSQYSNKLNMNLAEAVDEVLLENQDPATVLKEAAAKTNQQIEDARRIERLRDQKGR